MDSNEGYEDEYSLVMSFWIDTDGYTDRDREMFICGVEFRMLYDAVSAQKGWNQYIHTENESRVRMMCGKLGVEVKMKRVCDTWTDCHIPAMGEPDDVPPTVEMPPLLKLTCCSHCIYRGTKPYPTADSFEVVDEWFCKKAENKRIALHETFDKDPPVPTWCPVRQEG